MEVNIKYFYLMLAIIINSLIPAQKINVVLEDNVKNYKDQQITLHYIIENPNPFAIYFIFNENNFSEYGIPDFYYWDDENILYENNKDEEIFNPRSIFFDIDAKDTLNIVPTLHTTPTIEYLVKCKQKENNLFEIRKNHIIEFQKKYFPEKNLIWNKRAKYINENLIILKPFESRNFQTTVNFTELLDNNAKCNLSNVGFNLEKDKYSLSIKIHNDNNRTLKYLTSINLEKIKKNNAQSLDENFYSNSIILNIKKK